MRIHGKKVSSFSERTLVLPRYGVDPETGKDVEPLIFTFRPVKDWDGFNDRCPEPDPPMGIRPGGPPVPQLDHPTYLAALGVHAERKTSYLVLTSVSATEGLEWDTVEMDDPGTWENYATELEEAGLTPWEVNKVVNEAMIVNSLSDEALQAARDAFLASSTSPASSDPSPQDASQPTPSGVPASDSGSGPQE